MFVRVQLVVKFEGVVSVSKVLLGLRLYLLVGLNPVEKFGAVTCVFVVSRLIRLKSLIMAYSLWRIVSQDNYLQ